MGYSNFDVAHRFATGIGSRCTGSNMFFEGNIIYSYGYHFPIAIKYKGWLLYNTDSYSVSTAKHQNYVLTACQHYDIVHCATLKGWNDIRQEPSEDFFKRNFDLWQYQMDESIKKMAAARKPEKWMSEILYLVEQIKRFCDVFGIPVPDYIYKFKDKDAVEKVRAYAREEQKRQAERKRQHEAEEIEKFLEFKRSWVNLPYDIVRYREDKNRFETSKSVEIPYEIGKRLYEAVRDGRLQEGDKVLHYCVNKVGDTIEIGCHTFKKRYILDYGKKIFNE